MRKLLSTTLLLAFSIGVLHALYLKKPNPQSVPYNSLALLVIIDLFSPLLLIYSNLTLYNDASLDLTLYLKSIFFKLFGCIPCCHAKIDAKFLLFK